MEEVFNVIILLEEDMFVAEFPEVGTVSQRETVEIAINNLREATEIYLEEFPIKKKWKVIISFFTVSQNGRTKESIRC